MTMFHQKSITLLVLVVVVVSVQGQEEVVQPGPPDVCPSRTFNVQFHKAAPSVEIGELRNCSSYQDKLSCCTQALTDTISMLSIFEGLYNWSYSVCGDLSESCAQYTRDEECFYWCEPMLGHFRAPGGGIQNVPVCADYCDRWFEACKNDLTCYEDWGVAIVAANGMPNSCPEGSQCRTFGELFGDGQGLCNRLWGPSWNYSTDTNNCTVMAFDNSMPNPNYRLTFPRSGSLSSMVVLGSTLMQVSAMMLMYLLLAVVAINGSY